MDWQLKAFVLLAMTWQLAGAVAAQSAAFRVETTVLIEPVKRTLTLFADGVCYDFALDESAAITIVDPARGRILLLDPVRQVKTRLDMAELLGLVDNARQEAAGGELKGLFEAAQKGSFDEASQTVTVGDERLLYRATLQQPSDKDMADQYATFADWSARLNAVFSPHFPPYLRLELNRLVAAQGKLPLEITRKTVHQGEVSTVRCRLNANWRISTEDDKEIRRAGELLAKFKEVDRAEYFARPRIARGEVKLAK